MIFCIFTFICFQTIFLFFISSLTHWFFRSGGLISTLLSFFQFSSCYWSPVSYHCSWIRCLVWFQSCICYGSCFSLLTYTLNKTPDALEKNMNSADVWWIPLYTSVKSIWSKAQLKSHVSLLIFCLMIFPQLKWGIEVPYYYCIVCFSLCMSVFV